MFGEKVPVPEVAQVPPVAIVTLPARKAPVASAQIVWSTPASTVGISVKVITTLSE